MCMFIIMSYFIKSRVTCISFSIKLMKKLNNLIRTCFLFLLTLCIHGVRKVWKPLSQLVWGICKSKQTPSWDNAVKYSKACNL